MTAYSIIGPTKSQTSLVVYWVSVQIVAYDGSRLSEFHLTSKIINAKRDLTRMALSIVSAFRKGLTARAHSIFPKCSRLGYEDAKIYAIKVRHASYICV